MFRLSLGATALLTVFSTFLTGVQALPSVTRTGRYLYDSSGTRFYIKGVAYQPQGAVVASSNNAFGEPSSFTDPLSLSSNCTRDIPYLQQLDVNTIRVYSVNSSLNHDGCMSSLSTAGIYTIIDLPLPGNGSIDRSDPSWSTNLLDEYTRTIDAFSKYDNVLAYNIGNEVVTTDFISAAPFVKAAARDIKAYLASKGSSALVGYAAIDGDTAFRYNMAEYLTCDPSGNDSPSTSIDLFGLNDYEWCGDSTFAATYAAVTTEFANYNVVAYFSEFGCNSVTPRPWTEVTAMYSSNMNTVWSGGVAFSYFPAESAAGEYGMVTISADGKTVTTSTDFTNLATEYKSVTLLETPAQSSVAASQYSSCPTTIEAITISSSLPPTPNDAACNCLKSTLSCQFTPATTNYTAVVGSIIDNGCSLLGGVGGSCADISGNGTTGVYGRVSDCDPTVLASYVMSLYYEAESKAAQACSFAGNGTVNTKAPSSVSAANAAASSCITNPGAVFTPTGAATTTGSSSTSTSKSKGAAVSLVEGPHTLFGLTMTAVVTLLGGLWTLA